MKKAIAIMLSVSLIFALTVVSFAAEKQGAAPAGKEAIAVKKATTKQVTGEVAAVDVQANKLTVKGKKGDVTISVDDKTKITAGKEKKALADIKAGNKVTVKYAEADGKNTAKSIDIKVPPAEKKAAAPAEEKKAAPAEKKK